MDKDSQRSCQYLSHNISSIVCYIRIHIVYIFIISMIAVRVVLWRTFALKIDVICSCKCRARIDGSGCQLTAKKELGNQSIDSTNLKLCSTFSFSSSQCHRLLTNTNLIIEIELKSVLIIQGPDLYAFIGFIGFIGPDDINYMC